MKTVFCYLRWQYIFYIYYGSLYVSSRIAPISVNINLFFLSDFTAIGPGMDHTTNDTDNTGEADNGTNMYSSLSHHNTGSMSHFSLLLCHVLHT